MRHVSGEWKQPLGGNEITNLVTRMKFLFKLCYLKLLNKKSTHCSKLVRVRLMKICKKSTNKMNVANRRKFSPCMICGGKRGIGADFCQINSVFYSQYHSTWVPYSYIFKYHGRFVVYISAVSLGKPKKHKQFLSLLLSLRFIVQTQFIRYKIQNLLQHIRVIFASPELSPCEKRYTLGLLKEVYLPRFWFYRSAEFERVIKTEYNKISLSSSSSSSLISSPTAAVITTVTCYKFISTSMLSGCLNYRQTQ